MTAPASLRDRLARSEILVAPGVFDALTALLAEAAGFEAVYMSGASVAYTRLGLPDIGLTTMSEMANTLCLIRDRIALPIIVDGDTGFGNALNAQRMTRLYERAGANAIQLEDQTFPKRCGHLADKSLISVAEMCGKIRAVADARASDETLIIARTDAIAVEGFEAALDRGAAYLDAGADALFVEAPRSREELARIATSLGGRAPLMANMVEGGATPDLRADELEALGFSLVIFPGGIVRAVARTAEEYYASLRRHGSNQPFGDRMLDFRGLNDRLGTDAMIALGRGYEPGGG
ncbi:2-methylisocitrate lyase-like PEP mutase family enzyme [Tepidamorphus gemmatus]|uniref:2-methylisocitrate lyase-like PEP mutase family enzyme n=1 Tax=Tepidamorphus gemmatus TaxID=747076 RepID=A0A4R3MGU0_9HYPH|nr:isocitrate lyase/phosphoenolpyruvate mutase family protein [Tepidamorphus gemmatus]TCT11567.1 2-methylisocitrate lyase-like PEP mutase family enzyme [Tepidamorphus gemmatus]